MASVTSAFRPKAAIQNTSICAGCDNKIQGRALVALGQKWHSQCFQCSQCATPIETSAFGVRSEQPWCQKCLNYSNIATTKPSNNNNTDDPQPNCGRCGRMVNGVAITFGGKSWCHSCVVCSHCELIVEPGHGFIDATNSSILCDTCANHRMKNRATCHGCSKPIVGKFVKANGQNYHRSCLKCNVCSVELRGGYAKVDDKILCVECASQSKNRKPVGFIPRSNLPKSVMPKTGPMGMGMGMGMAKSSKPSTNQTVKPVKPVSLKPEHCPKCSTPTCEEGVFCGECGTRLVH